MLISTGYILFKTVFSSYEGFSSTIPVFFSPDKKEILQKISEFENEYQNLLIQFEQQSDNIDRYIDALKTEWVKFKQKNVIPNFEKGLPHPSKYDSSFNEIKDLNERIGFENRRYSHSEYKKFSIEWMTKNPPDDKFKDFISTLHGVVSKVELDRISFSCCEMNTSLKSQLVTNQNI